MEIAELFVGHGAVIIRSRAQALTLATTLDEKPHLGPLIQNARIECAYPESNVHTQHRVRHPALTVPPSRFKCAHHDSTISSNHAPISHVHIQISISSIDCAYPRLDDIFQRCTHHTREHPPHKQFDLLFSSPIHVSTISSNNASISHANILHINNLFLSSLLSPFLQIVSHLYFLYAQSDNKATKTDDVLK